MEQSGLLSHPSIRIRTANDKSYNDSSTYADVVRSLPPLSETARKFRILLLEPLYPSGAAWGSAKVEQGYLPPIGLISIYSFLKYRGFNVELVDTQFSDHTEESVRKLLSDGQYDIVGIPVFTSTADYCFSTRHGWFAIRSPERPLSSVTFTLLLNPN